MRCDPISKSVEWGLKVEDGHEQTNWARLNSKAWCAYMDRSKRTIMRNQLQMGFDNTIWPCLSRLLIMGQPQLAAKIHPRTSSLDNQHDRERLVEAYRELAGADPRVTDWRRA